MFSWGELHYVGTKTSLLLFYQHFLPFSVFRQGTSTSSHVVLPNVGLQSQFDETPKDTSFVRPVFKRIAYAIVIYSMVAWWCERYYGEKVI